MANTVVLRGYQARIVQSVIENGNTIVVLPTGSGKTLIAAELIKDLKPPALFLVPKCLLVEQQAAVVREWTGFDVQEFMGNCIFPKKFDVLVSTPKAFLIQQERVAEGVLSWEQFNTIVFDEVHHVLKEHPYRKIALKLRSSTQRCGSRVLGLTASLTYAVNEKKVTSSIARICEELRISNMQTASTEEMKSEGYHASKIEAQLKPVDIFFSVPDGVVPVLDRKPHLMLSTFLERQKQGRSTAVSMALFSCVIAMESDLASRDPSFSSPIDKKLPPKEWGAYAHQRAAKGCILSTELEHWYEAARLLVVTWEEAEDAAITFLRMYHCGQSMAAWSSAARAAAQTFMGAAPRSFPRLENLRSALISELDSRPDFRGLVFVQQRVMTHILDHFVRAEPTLSARLRPACLYASSSRANGATPSLSISAAQARSVLADFASGRANLLITTVVAEEGMDVPAANCVLRFDPVLTPVSFVQGRGRARQDGSSFLVLSERCDRTVAQLAQAEQLQASLVQAFKPPEPGSAAGGGAAAATAQRSRERAALASLSAHCTPGGAGPPAGACAGATEALRLWCHRTKAELREEFVRQEGGGGGGGGGWACTLGYSSVLRSIPASGSGQSKKAARDQAAARLVRALADAVGAGVGAAGRA